jgi:hypothetical protein
MSAPQASPSTASPVSTDDTGMSYQQLMAALTRLTHLAEQQERTNAERLNKQESINAELLARQEQMLTFMEDISTRSGDTAATTSAATVSAAEEEKDREEEERRKHKAVRESRRSVILENSNNSTMYTGDLLSPTIVPPQARSVQTEAEIERRQSHGVLFTPPGRTPKTPAPTAAAASKLSLPFVDKSRHSKYYEANQAMSKMDKFYGDRKNDKDIDVYTFVRGIDFNLDRWMQGEEYGRLELVIGCTGGAAQMWLLSKREDLLFLFGVGKLAAELTEWRYVKADFIEHMGGGQTQRLYQTKLETLKLGKGDNTDELTKFVSAFREYSNRAYPLDQFPDTGARTLMLGKLFDDRVRESDTGVWSQMMRTTPRPEKLEDLERALTSSWMTEQRIRAAYRNKRSSENAGGARGKGGYAPNTSSSQALHAIGVEGENDVGGSREEGETGEVLQAAATKKTNGSSVPKRLNKHINGLVAARLIRLNRCLHCYMKDHYARECKAPANRAPTEAELKA